MLSTVIHTTGAATFGYASYYQFFRLRVPPQVIAEDIRLAALDNIAGKLWYLTNWNLLLQFAYYVYSLANDIMGSSELELKKQTQMQKIRDSMFASVVFPVGAFVSITFWGLWAVDRELVFPKILDSFYPWWLHHAAHTWPIILVLIEFYHVPKVFPKRSGAIRGTASFTTVYLARLLWVAFSTGVWAYPVLEKLDNVSRTAFIGSSGAGILGLYFLGEKFQKWRWGAFSGTGDEAEKVRNDKKKVK